jgi:hypothetical protein
MDPQTGVSAPPIELRADVEDVAKSVAREVYRKHQQGEAKAWKSG